MFRVVNRLVCALALLIGVLAMPLRAQPTPLPLEVYGALPDVTDIAMSPSGKRLAKLVNEDGVRAIMIVDEALEPIFMIGLEDTKVRSFDFVTDDLLLMQRSTTETLGYEFTQDRAEFFQAFVINIESGESNLIFEDRDGLVNAVFGYYGTRMINGRPNAFFGAIELARGGNNQGGKYIWNNTTPALYAVDLSKNRSRRVATAPDPGKGKNWLVGESGEVVAQMEVSGLDGDWQIRGSKGTIATCDGAVADRAHAPRFDRTGWFNHHLQQPGEGL